MKRLIPLILIMLLPPLAGCWRPVCKAPPPVKAVDGVRVRLDCFINAGYKKGRSLPGLETTARAVETTLGQWYTHAGVGQRIVDGSPAELVRFLSDLPGPEVCDISVVYIGSIQTAGGALKFTNEAYADWGSVLREARPAAHPQRIVILDVCHAAAVRDIRDWPDRFAPVTLLASGRTEWTFQFEPVRLAPIDVRKHYPQAGGWAQAYLGPGWDRHVSFLGLMWMATAAQTSVPPADRAAWEAFLAECSRTAADFGRSRGRRWASTLQMY